MKSQVESSSSGVGAATMAVLAGRVHKRGSKEVENEEIQKYLTKLKELVPFMPNRKLSKLEVIQYVIEYICDLQYALETHPAAAAAAATAVAVNSGRPVGPSTASSQGPAQQPSASRQPLGVISTPNALIAAAEPSPVEKESDEMDTRSVPC